MTTLPSPKKNWLHLAILAAPFVAIAVNWNRFPHRITVHWNLYGRPDGWADKGVGLLLCPMLNVVLALLLIYLPKLDPKLRRNSPLGEKPIRVIGIIRLAFAALISFISLVIVAVALGYSFNVTRLTVDAALVLFIILGNFYGSLRPNYFFGLKTPWTLESPEVWRATHRAGGPILVFGSIALLASQFLLKPTHFTIAVLSFFVAVTLWSFIYSYWRYKALKR